MASVINFEVMSIDCCLFCLTSETQKLFKTMGTLNCVAISWHTNFKNLQKSIDNILIFPNYLLQF